MSFHNILLPICMEPFLVGKSVFNTSKITTSSGREIRSLDNDKVRMHFMLKDCYLSEADFATFNNFFLGRRGSRFAFMLKNFADYYIEKQNIGIGDGENKNYAFYRTYYDEKNSYIRKIHKINKDSVKVFIDEQESFQGWKIDEDKMEIVFNHAPGVNISISISLEFYIFVRFVEDSFDYKLREDGTVEVLDLSLIEVLR